MIERIVKILSNKFLPKSKNFFQECEIRFCNSERRKSSKSFLPIHLCTIYRAFVGELSKRFEHQKIKCQRLSNLTAKYTVTLTSSSATGNLLKLCQQDIAFSTNAIYALEARNANLSLNVRKLPTILAKLPVATATSERSFSIK